MKERFLIFLSLVLMLVTLSSCTIETVEQHNNKNTVAAVVQTTKKNEETTLSSNGTITTETMSEFVSTTRKNDNINNNQTTSQNTTVTQTKQTTVQPATTKPTTEPAISDKINITISIDCSKAVGHKDLDKSVVLLSAIVLDTTSMTVKNKTTALAATKQACSEHNIYFYETYGYVHKIGPIAERECGATSGWTYYVNDEFVNISSSAYRLKDGDKITWVYSPSL